MNNDELKKKIIDIIHDAEMCSAKNNCDTCKYGQELMKYKDMSCRTLKAADALITAWIGDTSELEVKCEVLQRDVDNLTRTLEEGAEELKEAQHRGEVEERALRDIATYCAREDLDYFSLTSVAIEARAKELYDGWMQQAEKELAEERK